MQTRWATAITLVGVVTFGCGDDSNSNAGPAAPSFMPATVAPPAPAPTQPQPPGPMPAQQPPAVPPPEPVMCGSVTCSPPASPLGAFGAAAGGLLPTPVACCIDESAGTCGVAMAAGAQCAPLATPDTRCPSIDLGMFAALAGNLGFGCCNEMNQCGVDGATFGQGCVENGAALSMLGPLSAFLMVPAAQACDAPPPDMVDAGMEMGDGGLFTGDAGM